MKSIIAALTLSALIATPAFAQSSLDAAGSTVTRAATEAATKAATDSVNKTTGAKAAATDAGSKPKDSPKSRIEGRQLNEKIITDPRPTK